MIRVKPKRGKLRGKAKKPKSPGILMILGGLLLAGMMAQLQGTGRSPLVWEDFNRAQGIYMGQYFKQGKPVIVVKTPDGLLNLGVDAGVKFTRIPAVGMPVEVAYTKAEPYRIVRKDDLKPLDVPTESGTRYNPWKE